MKVNGQLHAPQLLASAERAPSTHSTAGWVGSRDSLDAVEKRKIFPWPGIKTRFLGCAAHSLVTYTHYPIPAVKSHSQSNTPRKIGG
jgi:hypothetical protein